MTRIRLLLDEQIWLGLAQALRASEYDVVHVNELRLRGTDDEPLLEVAAEAGRALLTNNVRDFAPVVELWYNARREHAGVVFTISLPRGELLKQTTKFLQRVSAEELRNTCRWLREFSEME